MEQQLEQAIYDGLWFTQLTDALKAFITETQKYVNGVARVKLYKGQAFVVGRKSENSLYDLNLATYSKGDEFDHEAALGFIKLWGLPTKVHSTVNNVHADKAKIMEKTKIDMKESVKQ